MKRSKYQIKFLILLLFFIFFASNFLRVWTYKNVAQLIDIVAFFSEGNNVFPKKLINEYLVILLMNIFLEIIINFLHPFTIKTQEKFLVFQKEKLYVSFLESIAKIECAEYLKKFPNNKLFSYLKNDISILVDYRLDSFLKIINSLFYLFSTMAMFSLFHWSFLFIFLISFFFQSLIFLLTKKFNEKQEFFNTGKKKMTTDFLNLFENFGFLYLFGAKNLFAKKFHFYSEKQLKAKEKFIFLNRIIKLFSGFLNSFLNYLIVFLIYFIIIFDFIPGVITPGAAIIFFSMNSFVSGSFEDIFVNILKIRSVSNLRKKLFKKITNFSKILSPRKENFFPEKIEKIEVKNLKFAYGQPKILDNFSFTFRRGKRYAIVGKSGVGKSTLVKILLSIIENYEGKIALNGRNYRKFPESFLGKNFLFFLLKTLFSMQVLKKM